MIRADFLRTVVLAPIAALFGKAARPAEEERIPVIVTETFDPYTVRMAYFDRPAHTIRWSYQEDPTSWKVHPNAWSTPWPTRKTRAR